MRYNGFTLVELLVVIAILSVLLAVLMPSLSRARRVAMETVCASDVRTLVQASVEYAAQHSRELPDLSQRPKSGSDATSIYWSWPRWRRHFEDHYGIQREQWYSPTNPRWNRDDFYYWNRSGPPYTDERSTNFVMGRFSFASDIANSKEFYDSMPDPPVEEHTQLFPQRLSDSNTTYSFIWTDLNRQWPGGPMDLWVTPGDPNRHGANHLYDSDGWPTGSHVGFLDGHVEWATGDEIKLGSRYHNADLFWQNPSVPQ